MNSYQAKQIPISNFLELKGCKPVKQQGNDEWYLSPLIDEKTPSFKVNKILNTFYCFSTGQGGTIIDLVIKMYCCNIKEALNILSGSSNFSTPKNQQSFNVGVKPTIKKQVAKNQLKLEENKPVFEILKIKPLLNPLLIKYLESRKINIDIAKKYLSEIYFKHDNNRFYGLAFKNNLGAYEVRNERFKGCVGGIKDISVVNYNEGSKLAIFEGFLDFLSYLTHYNITDLQSTVLVLNSTNLVNKANDYITANNFSKVYLFLDNDSAGIEAGQKIIDHCNDLKVVNKADIYNGFNDFNDFLMGVN